MAGVNGQDLPTLTYDDFCVLADVTVCVFLRMHLQSAEDCDQVSLLIIFRNLLCLSAPGGKLNEVGLPFSAYIWCLSLYCQDERENRHLCSRMVQFYIVDEHADKPAAVV